MRACCFSIPATPGPGLRTKYAPAEVFPGNVWRGYSVQENAGKKKDMCVLLAGEVVGEEGDDAGLLFFHSPGLRIK